MHTEVRAPDADGLAAAASILRAGGLVAFPTETVYGLGADALDAAAVRALFEAKERPADNPLIVHVNRISDAVFAEVDDRARALAAAFWPGPLSVVLPLIADVPAAAGLDTVAVRAPAHPVAQALIDASGLALAAPSANRSGRPSPTTAAHVLADLDGRIPMIVDGGACAVGIESTVLSLVGPPMVLRPGVITRERIAAVLGHAVGLAPGSRRSPGTRHPHYRPRTPVVIVASTVSPEALEALHAAVSQAGRICTRSRPSAEHRFRAEAQALSRALYADLRDLDEAGVPFILVEGVAEDHAVMERLRRAATTVLRTDADVQAFIG